MGVTFDLTKSSFVSRLHRASPRPVPMTPDKIVNYDGRLREQEARERFRALGYLPFSFDFYGCEEMAPVYFTASTGALIIDFDKAVGTPLKELQEGDYAYRPLQIVFDDALVSFAPSPSPGYDGPMGTEAMSEHKQREIDGFIRVSDLLRRIEELERRLAALEASSS